MSPELVAIGEAIGALTGPAVLALIVVLLLRGDLVTRRSHESIMERCVEELAKAESDRDQWREVAWDALHVTEAAMGKKR